MYEVLNYRGAMPPNEPASRGGAGRARRGMRVSAQQAPGALRSPDPGVEGYLLYGADAAEVDAARADLARRLIKAGGEGSELSWTDGPAARRDPGGLEAALRAGGLFGGRLWWRWPPPRSGSAVSRTPGTFNRLGSSSAQNYDVSGKT